MKIVVLDGYTLNPGDLSWAELEKLGDITVFDRVSFDKTIESAKDAEILLTNKTILNKSIIQSLPNLKYIGVLATGYNVVDIETTKQKGIIVTNVPAYSTKSVAQMVFALILELTLNVGLHSNSVHNMEWTNNPDFSYWKRPLIELDGLTLGIIGYGQIGKAVANLGNAFGMKILANNRSKISNCENYTTEVSFDELLQLSDIVSLHLPLTNESKNIISEKELRIMKKSSFLINTSRGPLINENDLADALNNSGIAGAGLDVLSTEPPSSNNPLLQAKNCFLTPHIAWATKASRKRLMTIAVENVKAYINKNPQNVVG